MWRHLLTKLASYKVPLVMVSTHGSVVPLAMFLKFVFLPRPLGKELYAGAIDACGGKVLANILPLVWRQTFLFR